MGKEYVILSSDKHANFLKSHKKDPADYRPDILHQVKFYFENSSEIVTLTTNDRESLLAFLFSK